MARSEMIEHLFDIDLTGARELRYNIAPTQTVLGIVSEESGRKPHLYRWGLIPPWAPDPSVGTKMINAKSETVFEKPAYRSAIKSKRVAIPCSGFYEWRAVQSTSGQSDLFEMDRADDVPDNSGYKKEPLMFFSPKYDLLAFAGLWERWRSKAGEVIFSCTLLTTEPNEVVSPFHNRMPCLLTPQQVEEWISPEAEPQELMALMQPCPAENMAYRVVDARMNDSKTEAKMDQTETLQV